MEAILIHLLKSSALLIIFLISYLVLLRKERSFVHNRIFLLVGLLSSALLPLVTWTKIIVIEASFQPSVESEVKGSALALPQPEFGLWEVLGYVYLVGLGILMFRILYQLIRIFRLSAAYPAEADGNLKYVKTRAEINPFSFFNLIVYNPGRHPKEELQMILEHEMVHVRQLHSIDILLATISCALLWFNPFSWFYRRLVEQNLEFLADKETLEITGDKKKYRYALLRLSAGDHFPGLTSSFQKSFIRSRILMLERRGTSGKAAWKYLMVLPFLLLFLYSCNVQEEVQLIEQDHSAATALREPSFLIDRNTSEADFRKIEKYFRTNYKLQLAFTGIKHNNAGFLSGFGLSTRFEGQEHFEKRLENFAHEVLKPRFVLQYEPDEARLRIREIMGEEIEFEITQEAIHASRSLQQKRDQPENHNNKN